jgi:alpha-tubulin suppressor-like RCC1 family protein
VPKARWGTARRLPIPFRWDVSGLQSGVVAITARYLHACALTATGGVKCWGGNQAGELGDGTYTQRNTPIDVVGLTSGVVAISAGTDHTCAQLADGSVRCWGRNDIGGQLGNGNAINSPTPVSVIGLDAPVLSLAAGGYFSCAREAVGVECWGDKRLRRIGGRHHLLAILSDASSQPVERRLGACHGDVPWLRHR